MFYLRYSAALALVALALVVAACGGGGGDEENPAPRASVEAPSQRPTPPSAPGSLPPEFLECVTDQGFDIESEADIHSVPPQVLQACFGALHGGGRVP